MKSKTVVAGAVDDFKDNEMRMVSPDNTDQKILICRVNQSIYALSPFCPHYGAPLEEGILSGERIICPWHHACFNVKTGDLLEPPSNNALIRYEISVENDQVLVKIPDDQQSSRLPDMTRCISKSDERTFIIVGAGAAGYAASQSLREHGFDGRICMITQENKLSYDRPNLSKDYLNGSASEEWMPLRSQDFYDEFGIELLQGRRVTGIDTSSKIVTLDDSQIIEYDKILIATGAEANKLNVPGSDLKNIFTLRSYADADKIINAAENLSHSTVIGSSFIAMETANSLSKRGLKVVVVSRESEPFQKIFGSKIGSLIRKEYEHKGISFKLDKTVTKFTGERRVQAVVLDDGDIIETELVILGIGVKPATKFIKDIELNADGSIKVDKYLRVTEDVYAAGDIASYYDSRTDAQQRIEHWRTAQQQGRIAAQNMLGSEQVFAGVPFFWTSLADLKFSYVGHAEKWDEVIYWGDPSTKEFLAFYVLENKVKAALGSGKNLEMTVIEELFRLGLMPDPEVLRDDSTDLLRLLEEHAEDS